MIYSSTRLNLNPDEIRIASNQLGRIIEYFKANPNTRVCVQHNLKDSIDTVEKELKKLSYITTNYTVAAETFYHLRELLHRGIPAYLDFPVADWEMFDNLVNIGITDILIDGPLGFQMDQINKRKGNIKIRVRPHASVNASLSFASNEDTFFIRPEDVDTYSAFVDILEITGEDSEKEETIFNIYKRKSFNQSLSFLIKQLNISVANPYLTSEFAKNRLNCGQVCKRCPGRCQKCKTLIDITNFVVKDFRNTKRKVVN